MHEPMMGLWGLVGYVFMVVFFGGGDSRSRIVGQVMARTRTAWLSVTRTGISCGDSEKALRSWGD